MDFTELVHRRYSVRNFTWERVDREILLEIIETARYAPSAVNFQPWHFIIIDDPEKLNEFQKVYPRAWFGEAPACIVVCSDHRQSWKRKSDNKDFADVDAAIVTDHLILKATELGLGTCWVCNFDTELTRKLLLIPEYIEPLAIIPIGFFVPQAQLKTRKSFEELIHWQTFEKK